MVWGGRQEAKQQKRVKESGTGLKRALVQVEPKRGKNGERKERLIIIKNKTEGGLHKKKGPELIRRQAARTAPNSHLGGGVGGGSVLIKRRCPYPPTPPTDRNSPPPKPPTPPPRHNSLVGIQQEQTVGVRQVTSINESLESKERQDVAIKGSLDHDLKQGKKKKVKMSKTPIPEREKIA